MSDLKLWQAVRDNNVAHVSRCLVRKDKVDGRGGEWHTTPLMEATSQYSDSTVLLLLLCHGSDLEARDDHGRTALHWAAGRGSISSARVLTSLGADINSMDNFRRTPVTLAVCKNRVEVVRFLVEAGAQLSLKDKDGCTALDRVKEVGNKKVLSVIRDPAILYLGNSNMLDAELLLKLQSLPQDKRYSVLLLNNNKLSSLPDLTLHPQLSQLEVLNLSHNKLREIREAHLPPALKMVYMGHNNIHSLSPQMESEWLNYYHQLFTNSHQTPQRKVNLQDNQILAKTLHWGHAGLTDSELQKEILKLDTNYQCSVLLINNNKLTQLPTLSKYPQFADLKVIDASHNQLTNVDDKHLRDTLKIVHLGDNNIQHVTSKLEHEWQLGFYSSRNEKKVILKDNPISSTILQWNHLDLTNGDLQKMIEKLDTNYQCSILLINNNRLTQLPTLSKYSQFAHLKVIDASHNQLTNVDDKHLRDTLKIVHLGNNNIQHLTSKLELGFYSSRNEKKVILEDNPISSTILQWNHLDLTNGDLQKMIEKLDTNYQCSILLINNNRLTQLPEFNTFPQFSEMRFIQASHNKLHKHPDLSQMRKLKTLILTNNRIKQLEIEKLSVTVATLNLSNNIIEDLPDMKQKTNLKFISVSGNKLSLMPEFHVNLEHIDLDNNSLQSVRNQAVMKHLTYLFISGNKIVTLFGLSSKLQSIHIKGNPIRTLHRACFPSEEVYRLLSEALTQEQVDALQQPPPDIFRRGYSAVTHYYKQSNISRLANNSKNRMCFLGEATAGKTSLMQSLMSGVPCLTAEDDRTQVVDTHTWNITDQCSYQIFDQGGHPIYAITNMFFMSSNNKNIICHHIRDGSMKVTLEVVKRTVHLHPTSDIHFGLTKSDLLTNNYAKARMEEFQAELNKTFQKQIDFFEKLLSNSKYAEINKEVIERIIKSYRKKIKESRYFLLSSKQYKGILELRQFLCELAERDMKTLPELWWKCYTHIDSLKINVLTIKEFEDMFHVQRNIGQKLISIFQSKSSKIDMLSCLQYYHDCGLVLWFEDHPKLQNYIFHQLQYVIGNLKALFHHALEDALDYPHNCKLQSYFQEIEFHEAICKYQKEGLLSYKFLSYLWQEYELASYDQSILLELIKSFDICYQIQDKIQGEETLYYFPWFTKNNKTPAILNLSDLCVVNDKTLTLLLECVFFDSVPVNLTEMFIVCLQRHAVENHYLGNRYAWEDGLLVTVGNINIYVVRLSAKSTLYLGIRGEVDDLFEMWKAMAALHESFHSIIVQWHGVVRSLHIICPHCVLIGLNPPHLWPTSKVFPANQCSMLRVSCERESAVSLSGDRSATIPAAMVTLVETGSQKSATVRKHDSSPSEHNHGQNLQLHNKQKEFDDMLQYRGTYVLRELLLKQVKETWGHELELLLQDTSGGVIVKSGPPSADINNFQVQLYQNKELNLFEDERTKLKHRNIQTFDITLISKLLKVPKISGMKVTKKRWKDLQGGSVDDMLYPLACSIHIRLAGCVSLIVSYRNLIHNKTDHMMIKKEEIEEKIKYLSLALNELMSYIGISESEIKKHDDTQLVYKAPLTEVIHHATELNKRIQEMTGIKTSKRTTEISSIGSESSSVVPRHHQKGSGTEVPDTEMSSGTINTAASADKKQTSSGKHVKVAQSSMPPVTD